MAAKKKTKKKDSRVKRDDLQRDRRVQKRLRKRVGRDDGRVEKRLYFVESNGLSISARQTSLSYDLWRIIRIFFPSARSRVLSPAYTTRTRTCTQTRGNCRGRHNRNARRIIYQRRRLKRATMGPEQHDRETSASYEFSGGGAKALKSLVVRRADTMDIRRTRDEERESTTTTRRSCARVHNLYGLTNERGTYVRKPCACAHHKGRPADSAQKYGA